MRLCFIADARSPIAQNWIRYFIDQGHEVHVISSYPCAPNIMLGAELQVSPIGLTGLARIKHDGSMSSDQMSKNNNKLIQSLFAEIRSGKLSFISDFILEWLVPFILYRQSVSLRQRIHDIQPDLVHAMRIPREGITAGLATPESTPLIISVWGNDFTLWANRNPLYAHQTRLAVKRADALHSDCKRDVRLAIDWGFEKTLPTLVAPGAGGVDLNAFSPNPSNAMLRKKYGIPDNMIVILNPRGIRRYVRNEEFFAALVDVVKEYEHIRVLCTGMENNAVVEKWISQRNLQPWIQLLPTLPHERMKELYQVADISVSPSEHDGTPNSLLEAMASGCFIVAGDIESIREWIVDSYNGLLCNPTDIGAVAKVLLRAIKDEELRKRAGILNRRIVEEKADYHKVMPQAEAFYSSVIESKRRISKTE